MKTIQAKLSNPKRSEAPLVSVTFSIKDFVGVYRELDVIFPWREKPLEQDMSTGWG